MENYVLFVGVDNGDSIVKGIGLNDGQDRAKDLVPTNH